MEQMSYVPAMPGIEGSLERRGYKWTPIDEKEIGKMISDILRRANAKCYMMDVHTATKTYRNLFCSWLEYNNFIEKRLEIRFDPNTGSNFNVSLLTRDIREGNRGEGITEHIT